MRVVEIIDREGLDAIALGQRPDPQPGPGEIIIAVRAVSLNYRDLLVASGRYAGGAKPVGLIPASDGAGEVIAVGEGVTRVKVGDRVAGCFWPDWIGGPADAQRQRRSLGGGSTDGMLAEKVKLRADGVVHIPAHLSFVEAATLPCAAVTAWFSLFVADTIKPGQTVLLLGTGGVSIFALQFAKMAGARTIITSSSSEKLERAIALGADETIDYRTNPDWERIVLEKTGGRGVDHVVEVGGSGTFNRSVASARIGGALSMIGVLTGVNDAINTGAILHRSLRISGVYVGSRDMFDDMNRAIEASGLRPVIDKTFLFEDARAAYRHLESGRHFGKVAIELLH